MTEQTASARERIVNALEYMPDSDYPYSDYKDQVGGVADRIVQKGVPPPCQIERVLNNALNEVLGE